MCNAVDFDLPEILHFVFQPPKVEELPYACLYLVFLLKLIYSVEIRFSFTLLPMLFD